MLPVSLLIALMVLTWVGAIVATYTEADKTSSGSTGADSTDQGYHEAA